MEPKRWFITVQYLADGCRGIFCNSYGDAFSKEEPHTIEEMVRILGIFWVILCPESEAFVPSEIKEYTQWIPLSEFRNVYGIAYTKEQLNVS